MGDEVDGTGKSKEMIRLPDFSPSTKPTMSGSKGGDLRDTEDEHITITLGPSSEATSSQENSFLSGNYRIVYKQKDKVTNLSVGVLLEAVDKETGHTLTLKVQPRLLDSTIYCDILKKTQDQIYSDEIQRAVPFIKKLDAEKELFVGRWTVGGSQNIYSYIQCNINSWACFQVPTQQSFYNYQMWNTVTMVMYYRRLTNERELSFSIFTVDGNSCNAQLVDLDPPEKDLKRVVFKYTPTNSDNLLPEHIFSFKIEDNRSHTDFSDMGRIMYATLDDVCWYLTYDLATSRDGIVSVMATTCKAEAKRFYFVEPPFS